MVRKNSTNITSQAPYSPDLVSLLLFLFPKLKLSKFVKSVLSR